MRDQRASRVPDQAASSGVSAKVAINSLFGDSLLEISIQLWGSAMIGLGHGRAAVAAGLGLVLLTALSSSAARAGAFPSRGPLAATSASPCVGLAGTPDYSHVVVVMDENVSEATLRTSPQAPYLHGLAAQCGAERFMHAATHPSQANYMAATSGLATGVGVHTGNDNVFHQAQVHGDSWKSYEESMPRACAGNSGFYKSGHNPAFWYTDLRSPSNTCALYDVPQSPALDADIANDTLPALSWITPNACNDMHGQSGCPQPTSQRIAVGDTWLSNLIPRLTAMPSYQAGQTLIVVTWDEGNGKETNGSDCTDPKIYTAQASCQIPTYVVSPYIAAGRTDNSDHNLYGLLGDIQDILGYPRLGRAVGQSSLGPGLGF
jgi:phosphatidylinositol-3-phosphatase